MTDENKNQLKKDIDALDGEILDTFSEDCTHLTINKLKVTVKVLQCLTYAIPIVTSAYWKAYLTAIQKKEPLPNCVNFIPKLIEPYLDKNISFAANINRRRLFVGKTFAFMVKRHKDVFENVIQLAGGKCISLDQSKCRKNTLIQSNFVVVNYAPSTQSQCTQDIGTISDFIRSNNLRMIPDCEIGLAIIHCSIEKFCNPKYKVEENFMITSQSIGQKPDGNVLAENTPSTSENSLKSIDVDIDVPESIGAIAQMCDANNSTTESTDVITIMDDNEDASVVNENQAAACDGNQIKSNELPIVVPVTKEKNSKEQSVELIIEEEHPLQLSEKSSSPLTRIQSESKRKISSMSDEEVNNERPSKRQTIHTQNDGAAACSSQSMSQNTQSGWLTTQRNKSKSCQNNDIEKMVQQEGPSKGMKRAHNLLQDNDDDNSDEEKSTNLFQFSIPSKKKKANPLSKNIVGDDMFKFPNRNLPSSKKPTQVQQKRLPNEQISPNSTVVSTTSTVDPTVNIFHRSISVEPSKTTPTTWLSRSLSKNSVNTESMEIKKEEDEDESDDNWLKLMRNNFLVKVISMNLSTMSINKSISNEQTTNVPNFKTFVKKYNYQTQAPLLKTIEIND